MRELEADSDKIARELADAMAESHRQISELQSQLAESVAISDGLALELEAARTNACASDSESQQVVTLRSELESLESVKVALDAELAQTRTHAHELQTRLDELSQKLSNVAESDARLASVTLEKDAEIASVRSELQSEVHRVAGELSRVQAELEKILADKASSEASLGGRIAMMEAEIEAGKAAVAASQEQIRYLESRLNAASDVSRSDVLRLESEVESTLARLTEARAELAAERQSAVSTNGQLLQAQQTVHDLRAKLTKVQTDLSDATKGRGNVDALSLQNEQYLKTIQDVSFVMKTVTDKFISPNVSAVNSRAASLDEDGVGAMQQLDRNVQAILRLIEAVSDKAKIIEKENSKLENKLRDYEAVNSTLREKANRGFMQRLVDPIISCRWSGPSHVDHLSQQPAGVPMQNRHEGERSNLIVPPRQVNNM